jgi:hypothetical protein
MEMAVRSIETVETVMEIDGDGSRGTFPSRQGAGIEISVPRNSSAAAAELWNSSGNFADYFRVFRPTASYRRRGIIRSGSGGPHHRWARPGPGPRPLMVRVPSGPPSGSLSVLVLRPGKIGVLVVVSSNFKNISCVAFLKHKNNKKQGTGTVPSYQ